MHNQMCGLSLTGGMIEQVTAPQSERDDLGM